MKNLLAALLFVLITAFPAYSDQTDYAKLVPWTGCRAPLVVSDENSVFASHYNYGEGVMYIGTIVPEGFTREHVDMVLFHEITHCLQDQDGRLTNRDRVEVELEADKGAANLACMLGRDGKRLLREMFMIVHQTLGYEGDSAHGTLQQRIDQGHNATYCNVNTQS